MNIAKMSMCIQIQLFMRLKNPSQSRRGEQQVKNKENCWNH